MDGRAFDALTRTLAGRPSRRALAGMLLSGALGRLPVAQDDHAHAHNAAAKCKKIKDKTKRKKCLRKARAHNASHLNEAGSPPFTLALAQPAEHDALADASLRSLEVQQLAAHLTQAESMNSLGGSSAWTIDEAGYGWRLIAGDFVNAGDEGAVLTYGEDTLGYSWAAAHLVRPGEFAALLTYDSGGISRIEATVPRQSSARAIPAKRTAWSGAIGEIDRLIDTLGDQCFQCELLCKLGVDHAILGEVLGVERVCARAAAVTCGRMSYRIGFAVCAATVWSACAIVANQIKDQVAELGCQGACAASDACSSGCVRKTCPAGSTFSRDLCRCQCTPSSLDEFDYDLKDTPSDRCGGRCVYINVDNDHCGRCGHPCGTGEHCVNGQCANAGCPACGYELVAEWGGTGDGNGRFYAADGVAVSGNGVVYVSDWRMIQRFSPSGAFQGQWESFGNGDSFTYPHALAVHSSGTVYVADTEAWRIVKLSANGAFLGEWDVRNPTGIAVDASETVYVVSYDRARVEKFTASGGAAGQWSVPGCGGGSYTNPTGAAVDAAGAVYVTNSSCVQKFTSAGALVKEWGADFGNGAGEMSNPEGVAVDAAGNVYVADTGNDRIQKFAPGGALLAAWGSESTNGGPLNRPRGVAVAANGDVYVADSGNDRVMKYVLATSNRAARKADAARLPRKRGKR